MHDTTNIVTNGQRSTQFERANNPPHLRNHLTDYDEIWTLELFPKTTYQAKFNFDRTTWVVSINTQKT